MYQVYNMGPGSGKTQTALEVIVDVVKNGLNVVYSSITNNAVNDTKRRLKKMDHGLSDKEIDVRVNITTMHSYALDLLRDVLMEDPYNILEVFPSTSTSSEFTLPSLRQYVHQYKTLQNDRQRFLEAHTFRHTNENGDKIIAAEVPLDYVMHLYHMFDITPPDNDFLIIDEYQDMEQDEVYVLARSFGENAVLFGDINQTVFQFRWKDPNVRPIKPTNEGDSHQSYRLTRDSCELLNRIVTMKRSLTGADYTPNVYVESERELPDGAPSFRFLRHSYRFTSGKRAKTYEHVNKTLESISTDKEFTVMTATNYEAVIYTDLIESLHGQDILGTKYIALCRHPLYQVVRYLTRSGEDFTREERNSNANMLSNFMKDVITQTGQVTDKNGTVKTSPLVNSSNTPLPPSKSGLPSITTATEACNAIRNVVLEDKAVPRHLQLGKGRFTSDSEKAAFRTIVSILFEQGFAGSRAGIKYDHKHPKGKWKVLTMHTCKGLEADITLVDLRPSVNGIRSDRAAFMLQYLNLIYVALSRHREQCYCYMPFDTYKVDESTVNKVGRLNSLAKKLQDPLRRHTGNQNDILEAAKWFTCLVEACYDDEKYNQIVLPIIRNIDLSTKELRERNENVAQRMTPSVQTLTEANLQE